MNFPLILNLLVFLALLFGNSFILKPSEKSPLTAIRIAQLALDATERLWCQRLGMALRPQGLIALGLFPVLWVLDLPISLIGPLANLMAVPWISLAVLPTALLGTLLLPVPWLGESLLWVSGGLIDVLVECLSLLADVSTPWLPASVPVYLWLLCAGGVLILLLPAGFVLRPLGWPLVLLALFAPREPIPHGQVEVLQLDVGQGLAIALRTRNHTLLYDAGPKFGNLDQGERVVVPVLRSLGVGDLAWAAGDSRTRGFLIGGTAGRTTLNGEGLQHEDGHSHILAATIPNCRTFDPTYGYELAVIIQDGMKKMTEEQQDVF